MPAGLALNRADVRHIAGGETTAVWPKAGVVVRAGALRVTVGSSLAASGTVARITALDRNRWSLEMDDGSEYLVVRAKTGG